jgi:hypothetical protein
MSVLDLLAASPGVFWGEGEGPDQGGYAVRVAVQPQPDGSVTFDYESWAPHAGLHHAEAARLYQTDGGVLLVTTSTGGDALTFREGDAGVFGSIGGHRVGLVLEVQAPDVLTLGWWWPAADGTLRRQSRAVVRLVRRLVAPPPAPCPGGCTDPVDGTVGDEVASGAGEGPPREVPWPGILVLDGSRTGVVAQQLAERLTRAAVVRTDLFDQAVRGSGVVRDAALREQVALAVVGAYAAAAHPVILHGRSTSSEQRALAEALVDAGLRPVRLVEVGESESYGDVARRLIEGD